MGYIDSWDLLVRFPGQIALEAVLTFVQGYIFSAQLRLKKKCQGQQGSLGIKADKTLC